MLQSHSLTPRGVSTPRGDSSPREANSKECIEQQLMFSDQATVASDHAESITSLHRIANEWEQPNLHFELSDTALPAPRLPVPPDARDVPPAWSWNTASKEKIAKQETESPEANTSGLSAGSTPSASLESADNLRTLLSNLVQSTGRLADQLGDIHADVLPQTEPEEFRANCESQKELESIHTDCIAETKDGNGQIECF